MAARKKSRLESFFSLNQHRKRMGASKLSTQHGYKNLSKLKERIINIDKTVYTHGADKDLSQHLDNLKTEFAGKSELLYYHAQLIVLIRRGYKVTDNFKTFQNLWTSEKDFLLQELNTRWLISASDTFADHSHDKTERALALSVSLLANTIKLHETERYLQATDTSNDKEKRAEVLKNERVDLFDGTSAFAIGTDDTLRNMRWRLDDTCKNSPIVGGILQEVFSRVQQHDTAYSRFKARHSRLKTAWWD